MPKRKKRMKIVFFFFDPVASLPALFYVHVYISCCRLKFIWFFFRVILLAVAYRRKLPEKGKKRNNNARKALKSTREKKGNKKMIS
jgi:hypothetical protein